MKEHEQLAVWTQAATETLPHYNCGHVVGPRHKQSVVIAKFARCDVMSNSGNNNGRVLQASSGDCIPDKAFHTDVDLRKTMQEPGSRQAASGEPCPRPAIPPCPSPNAAEQDSCQAKTPKGP